MAVASYRELQPWRRVLAKFASDAGVIHERLALWPMASSEVGGAAGSYAVLTADVDSDEGARGDYSGFWLMDNADPKYPGDVVKH